MITVVYCTRQANPEYKEHLIKSSGLHKHLEVIEIINNGESLTKCYNRGLKQAKNNIVVFAHDDITFETNQWGNKLLKQFDRHPEYGIIGVAGTKNLPASGQWWENRKKMYGQVEHTHEGKTWLTVYSPNMGLDIEQVVVIDGLFMAIDKTKIKAEFDETVEGFHFYDISFCFENYLKGVKLGVITAIKINHKSIGMTNKDWDDNRLKFVDKYKDVLPVNIKKVLRKGDKLKVLIGCLNFSNFTGSELYVYELAKQLIKEGCDVSISSNIGDPLGKLARQLGVKTYTLQEPPGFKLGDGKWKLKTQNGEVDSQPNTLYKIKDVEFDVIHLNHKPVTEHLVRLYPNTPIVCSIHSEVISLEEPVISQEIKKYIAIRPEIKDFLINRFDIKDEQISVIYNPIDSSRFKETKNNSIREKKRTLFVGTIDYLRKNAIKDLIETTRQNEELWIVGKKNDTYLDDMIKNEPHVKYFEPTNNVEKFINQCDTVAGILLGRTTIEGWMCGKKAIIYDIDNEGSVLGKTLNDVPSDIDKFKCENVVKEIIEEYKSVLD